MRRNPFQGLALLLLVATALGLSGFAHRVMPAQAIDLGAYALPDGSIPDICITSDDSGSPHAADGHCDFCRLATAPGLPLPAEATALPIERNGVSVVSPEACPARSGVFHANAPVRGPPAFA